MCVLSVCVFVPVDFDVCCCFCFVFVILVVVTVVIVVVLLMVLFLFLLFLSCWLLVNAVGRRSCYGPLGAAWSCGVVFEGARFLLSRFCC